MDVEKNINVLKAMELEVVSLLGHNFYMRYLDIPGFGNVTISTHEANDILQNNFGENYSIELEKIDERIFFFVSEEEFYLKEESVVKVIIENLC